MIGDTTLTPSVTLESICRFLVDDSRGTGRDATLGLTVEFRGARLCKYRLTRNKETAHNEREVMSTIDSINRRSTPVHCSYVMTLLLDPGPRPACSQVRGEWRALIQRGSEGAYLRPAGLYVADVWTYAIKSRVEGVTWGSHVLGIAIR